MTKQKCGYLLKCSGIYQIKNLLDGKFYIGSSTNMMKRKRAHLDWLRRNIHHSRYLQLAYNKYGEDNFEFSVIELCDPDRLESREQHWLDNFLPAYNMAKTAYAPTRGTKLSSRTKKIVGNHSKKMWENPEHRKKIMDFVNTDEEHSRRSNNMLRLWNDPAYRKQHSESLYGKGNSKLSPDDVREIRRLHGLGIGSPTLCKMFRLKSTRSVFRILEGITYRWVD